MTEATRVATLWVRELGKGREQVRFWQPQKHTKVKERAVKEGRALEILSTLGWTEHLRECSWVMG